MPSRPVRRVAAAVAAGATIALLLGQPASAHVDPDPVAAQAGAKATIGFGIEHGCGESPTQQVDIQVPDGSSAVVAEPVAGWTTKVDGRVASWTGGSLGADTPGTFKVTLTTPATPGEVDFKVVQTCETGKLSWIEATVDGQPEPEHPAPVVKLTDGPPTAADLEGEEHGGGGSEDATTTTEGEHGHEGEGSEDATTTTAAGAPTAPTTTLAVASTTDDDGGSSTALVVGGIAVVVAAAGGGYLLYRRNQGSTES